MPLDRAAKSGETIIEEHLHGCSFDDYLASRTLRSAVQHEFTIIGEAMGALLKIAPEVEHSITDARKIVDFRNLLVHTYSRVLADAVWTIIQEKVPILLREVRALLR